MDGQAAQAPRAVSPLEFRRACGQFATGVTVVTVRDGARVRGMTVNSFTSISLEPPLILIGIDTRRHTHRLMEPLGTRLAVSILSEAHRGWADRFAGRHGDLQHRFDDVPHWLTPDGLPVLDGALAWLSGRVVAVHPAGDHSIFIAEVDDLGMAPGAPLLFFASAYHGLDRPTGD